MATWHGQLGAAISFYDRFLAQTPDVALLGAFLATCWSSRGKRGREFHAVGLRGVQPCAIVDASDIALWHLVNGWTPPPQAKLLLTRCLPQVSKPQMVETTITMDAVFGRVAELCASTVKPLVISPMVFCAASEHGTTGC